MKSLLHLVLVIGLASVPHDLQQFTTRSLGSEDHSLSRNHGNGIGGNSMGVLVAGVSAVPKRSQRSKLIFQISIDTRDPKKKSGKKRKGKKSVRAKLRKILINRRRSKSNHQKQIDRRRSHRHHYHTLRNQYIKKLKGVLKHGNHYHKPMLNSGFFKTCCRRLAGRKDVTLNKRRYGRKRPSRRQPSRRHSPFMRNPRRNQQHRRQNHRRRKTPIRRNNQHKRPALSRRNQWRRPTKVPRKHSSGRKGYQKKGHQARKIPRRRKTRKSKAVEVWAV